MQRENEATIKYQVERNHIRRRPENIDNHHACHRLRGTEDARHRPVQRAPVDKQTDNTADSVPRDRLQWDCSVYWPYEDVLSSGKKKPRQNLGKKRRGKTWM